MILIFSVITPNTITVEEHIVYSYLMFYCFSLNILCTVTSCFTVSVSSLGFTVVLGLTVLHFIKFLLWVVFIDCIGVGLLVATIFW